LVPVRHITDQFNEFHHFQTAYDKRPLSFARSTGGAKSSGIQGWMPAPTSQRRRLRWDRRARTEADVRGQSGGVEFVAAPTGDRSSFAIRSASRGNLVRE